MNYKNNLLHKLATYTDNGLIPFHMPGHKRNNRLSPEIDAYRTDITEIDGFDDLHHPDGYLKEAMERAAKVFGAKHTFFLINGCTGGILAAIHAVCAGGDNILLARNSHKSAYNAVMLNGLNATYVWPKGQICGLPCGSIQPDDIEAAFAAGKDIKCVFITSPTYEGVVSDIKAIAEITHRHNAILIVDEAHGSHMRFGDIFPAGAVECGADIVIHGIHKTLPSLTQSALLHIATDRVNAHEIKRCLSIFQSSSPSYLLMGATDYCIDFLINDGMEYFNEYSERLKNMYRRLSALKHLSVFPYGAARDASKVVISAAGSCINGLSLYDILRRQFNIQPEMSLPQYVIIMTSVWDDENDIIRLTDAIIEIDNMCMEGGIYTGTETGSYHNAPCQNPYNSLRPGNTADDILYVYPPGIPIIVTGEVFTEDIIETINDYINKGYTIKGNRG